MSQIIATLWGLAIGFPIVIHIFYFIIIGPSSSIGAEYFIVLSLSVLAVVIILSLRKFAFGDVGSDDVYEFYITDTEVVSHASFNSNDVQNYTIQISDIIRLHHMTHNSGDSNFSDVKYSIQTKDNKVYRLSPNYLNPGKVFKILRSINPDLCSSG